MNKSIIAGVVGLVAVLAVVFGFSTDERGAQIAGATVLKGYQGGTGLSSASAGYANKCLYLSNYASMTFSFDNCVTGGGVLQMREGFTGGFNSIGSASWKAGDFVYNRNGVHASISLDWTNGPASRSADQTITGFWKFTAASSQFNIIEFTTASSSGNAIFRGTGSSSFAGSLNTTLGVHALTNVSAGGNFLGIGTGSNSFAGSLNLSKGLHSATDVSALTGKFNTLTNDSLFLTLTGRASVSSTFEVAGVVKTDTLQNSTGTLNIGAFTLAGGITANNQLITGAAAFRGVTASISGIFEAALYASSSRGYFVDSIVVGKAGTLASSSSVYDAEVGPGTTATASFLFAGKGCIQMLNTAGANVYVRVFGTTLTVSTDSCHQ